MKKIITLAAALLFGFATLTQAKGFTDFAKSDTTHHLTKSGKPDKRYNANKHLKKDGTMDKRYSTSKKAAGSTKKDSLKH